MRLHGGMWNQAHRPNVQQSAACLTGAGRTKKEAQQAAMVVPVLLPGELNPRDPDVVENFAQLDESDPPVTVFVSRCVRPGCAEQFEAVMREMIRAANAFPGHLGATVFRPSDAKHPEYRVVFRFQHISQLVDWENSPERQAFLARLEPLMVSSSRFTRITGLEAWFALPGEAARTPDRHRMAFVTWIGVYLIGLLFAEVLTPRLAGLPIWLRVLIHSSIFVPVMLYGVLPMLTRLFRRFLYP